MRAEVDKLMILPAAGVIVSMHTEHGVIYIPCQRALSWICHRPCPRPGVTLEQAALLGALWGAPEGLVQPPRPCSIAELQALHARASRIPGAWAALGALWDTALRALGKFRGVPAPGFQALMAGVGALLRKPVRARCAFESTFLLTSFPRAWLPCPLLLGRLSTELKAAQGLMMLLRVVGSTHAKCLSGGQNNNTICFLCVDTYSSVSSYLPYYKFVLWSAVFATSIYYSFHAGCCCRAWRWR
jgi:hypothetical protein